MLLSGRGAIVERDDADPPSVLSSPSVLLAVVVRWDRPDVLARAINRVPREFSIVGPAEAEETVAGIVPRRSRERAVLYQLPPARALALPASPVARLLRKDEHRLLDNLPPILRGELRDACHYSPISSAFAEERPVSFCYSGWETETHWDVSIDTLDGYRRRGLGMAACTCLIHHFARTGKTAVWGAVESNEESGALARKLGFVPVDRLMVVYPDDAH
jgi:hypothetical protein